MASYFIGTNNTNGGFGGSGNFFAQLGELGPAWQRTMLQGLNTQHAFNEFQNQQIIDPYRVNAAASAYGTQGLQNLYASMEQDLLNNALLRDMNTGNAAMAQQQHRNMGYNPDQIQYGHNLVRQAPAAAQPMQPANTGGYAATAPTAHSLRPQYVPLAPQRQYDATLAVSPQQNLYARNAVDYLF